MVASRLSTFVVYERGLPFLHERPSTSQFVAERLQVLECLLVCKLSRVVGTLIVTWACRDDQFECFLFCVNREHRQKAIGNGSTEPYDDSSKYLDRPTVAAVTGGSR